MNSYNIYEEKNYSTILYHAIAGDKEQVMQLAEDAGINIDGLTIELERRNVKDELGRPYRASIESAIIQ